MIPFGDDNTSRRGPATVTWTIIGINIAVFILVQGFGLRRNATMALALIPDALAAGKGLFTLISAQFAHASLGHILGNMLFLGIFGDNVECRIGRKKYIALYAISGLAGMLLQAWAGIAAGLGYIPILGASAAISGVLGAYLALFPGNRVFVLLFNFIPSALSAWIVIGLWFVFQILGGLAGMAGGGVAYLAHTGGFVVAWIWAKMYKKREGARLAGEKAARIKSGEEGGVRWWIVDE